MPLTDDIVRSFKCGRIFKDNHVPVNSIDFHRTLDLLVTAAAGPEQQDSVVHIYDTAEPRLLASVHSPKYGCHNVVWTHAPDKIVFASSKGDDVLRMLQIGHGPADHQFLQYFKGHSGRVTKVALNPKNDTFLSAAQDKEVRLWDLRTPQCQAVLQAPCQPTVAFDQQGLVFAVGLDNGLIKLYDASNYEQGPFETFTVPDLHNSPVPFAHLSFSNDGKTLLAVVEGRILVLDAFSGAVQHTLVNGVTEASAPPEASLSYDGQYVLSGCVTDRSVRVWSAATGQLVASWADHAGVPYCAKWAPRRLMAASACCAVCLWVPSPEAVTQYLQQQPPPPPPATATQQQQQQPSQPPPPYQQGYG